MDDVIQEKELTLARVYNAPRVKVWNYWTDTQLIQQWWAPDGFTNPTCVWEAKPQGRIHIVMHAGQELGPLSGKDFPMTGKFINIQEPEKLVYSSSAIMDDKVVLETLNTVTFTERDGKTQMTVHIVVTKTTPEATGPLAGMEMGWNQQLDKLGKVLGSN